MPDWAVGTAAGGFLSVGAQHVRYVDCVRSFRSYKGKPNLAGFGRLA